MEAFKSIRELYQTLARDPIFAMFIITMLVVVFALYVVLRAIEN